MTTKENAPQTNSLFPVFLKLDQLRTLIIGGGDLAYQQMVLILKNSPDAHLMVTCENIKDNIYNLAAEYPNVRVYRKSFSETDLDGKDLLIIATDNPGLNEKIKTKARIRKIITSVAGDLGASDFDFGSVVKKGDLKIAISSNGHSPSLTTRLRDYLEESFPDDIQLVLDKVRSVRDKLKGDFDNKVKMLDKLTSGWLLDKKEKEEKLHTS